MLYDFFNDSNDSGELPVSAHIDLVQGIAIFDILSVSSGSSGPTNSIHGHDGVQLKNPTTFKNWKRKIH